MRALCRLHSRHDEEVQGRALRLAGRPSPRTLTGWMRHPGLTRGVLCVALLAWGSDPSNLARAQEAKGSPLESVKCGQLPIDAEHGRKAAGKGRLTGKEGPYGITERILTFSQNPSMSITDRGVTRDVILQNVGARQYYNNTLGGLVLVMRGREDNAEILLPFRGSYSCPESRPGTPAEDYREYAVVVEVGRSIHGAGGGGAIAGFQYPGYMMRVGGNDPIAGPRRFLWTVIGDEFPISANPEIVPLPVGFFPGTRITVAAGQSLNVLLGSGQGVTSYRIETGGSMDVRFDNTIKLEGATRLRP